jgi:hypothetical protein
MPAVKIPENFAKRIDALGPHFCLVKGKDPSVSGKGWQTPEKLMYSNDPRLQKWLEEGGNYGVVCGYGITVVEADDSKIEEAITSKLPATLTVLSGGHKKPHSYFLCSFTECKPLINPDSPEHENLGHIKAQGGMVVGPGSIHPESKQPYVLLHDRPIAQITPEQLLEALKPFLIEKDKEDKIEIARNIEKSQANIDLSILSVVPLSQLQRQGDEYFGAHPVHGSETGRNFWVNPQKNVWHCFRHGTGGGPLLWLAVEEGIIRCEDAGPGALRGEIFRKVLERAVARGLISAGALAKPAGKTETEPALAEAAQVGDIEITPLAISYTPVHPSIGVVADTAYVGVWLPASVKYKPKKKDATPKTKITDLLYLVTDKRELILANEEVLRQHGWSLAYSPIKIKATWGGVKEYLDGRCTVSQLELFSKILAEYRNYIEFPDEREYFLHALWDVGTYFYTLFNSYPYLYLGGIKRCGKSKVLTLHSCLAFNAFFSNNMSTSSIYRLIQNARGTLLIDETEKLSNPDRALEFRSIVLSGYKKGAVVYRIEKTKKEVLVPEAFDVYGPKALANIQGLEDILEDRCIVTFMKRGKNRKIVDKEVNMQDSHWDELRHGLYLLFLGHWREVLETYRQISELSELSDRSEYIERLPNFLGGTKKTEKLKYLTARELELWKPIFAIAKFFDNCAEKNNINIGEKLGLYRDKNEFTTPIHASSNISARDKTGIHSSNGVSVPYNRTNETMGNQRTEDRRNMVEDSTKESTVQANGCVRGRDAIEPSYMEQVGNTSPVNGMRHLPSNSKTLNESDDSLGRVQGGRDRERQTDRPAPVSTDSQYPNKQSSGLDREDLQEDVEKKGGVSIYSLRSLSSLSSLMLDLALDKAEYKQTENVTETGEVILVQVLLSMVKEDNYYRVKDIREKMAGQFDEDQKWLTTKWIGNALRRLGFQDKRRVGTGYECRLTRGAVEDLAERLGIESECSLHSPHSPSIRHLSVEECFPGKCSYCGAQTVIEAYADGFGVCRNCLKELEDKTKSQQAQPSQSQDQPSPLPSESEPKPKPKMFKCKCGAGPWRDYNIAREHLKLCNCEPGHEIQEVAAE